MNAPPRSRSTWSGLRVGATIARRGFTLTELLVAMTIALAVMAVVASLFNTFGRGLAQSQATVDRSARMRSAAWKLRQDLTGATVDLVPWTRPESDSGYFELIEGPRKDLFAENGTVVLEADTDDVLLFTTRSAGDRFVGRYAGGTIESPCAEVAWFCRPMQPQPEIDGLMRGGDPMYKVYTLRRRQLLVASHVGVEPFQSGNNSTSGGLTTVQQTYDISLRADGAVLRPNSLGDLTKRENRFLRAGAFPHAFLLTGTALSGNAGVAGATFDGTTRAGEDVVLDNVLSFDVRVFDPQAKAGTDGVLPGDLSYVPPTNGPAGAYVDLGWGGTFKPADSWVVPANTTFTPPASLAAAAAYPPVGATAFQAGGKRVSANASLTDSVESRTYDTWSLHYEFNGVDDDGDGRIDEGTNGIDDNADDLPDDPAESETSPPYPVPLRGIEVRIRCYEPLSGQIRQITVRHTFVGR